MWEKQFYRTNKKLHYFCTERLNTSHSNLPGPVFMAHSISETGVMESQALGYNCPCSVNLERQKGLNPVFTL